jgi:hypothetical protein
MKQIKQTLLTLIFACLLLPASGESVREELYKTIEKTAGVHYIYHYDNPEQTPAPKGYTPFYISHYGRHGSRWQTIDSQYTITLKIFERADEAGALSPFGKETYEKIKLICKDAVGLHSGDLSPLGFRQHREIAERMRRSFPEIFQGEKAISARATTVPRCILSMAAFCDTLKGANPKLQVAFAANAGTHARLNFAYHPQSLSEEFLDIQKSKTSKWYLKQKQFAQREIHPERLVASLFSDMDYARKSVDGFKLMTGLFNMASNMQNVDLDVSLYNIFERDELYKLWLHINYKFYAIYGASPLLKHYPEYYSIGLLKDILDLADDAMRKGSPAADFRFGHDTALIPLAALLQLENCHPEETDIEKIGEVFPSFRISPMAANIQLVFFKKDGSDDVLVKFLLNEVETRIPVSTGMFPYYHWKEVRKFYHDRMAGMKDPATL